MSILNRLQVQRETAREAATQTKPEGLSQDVQAQVQKAGLELVKNGVAEAKEAGYNGQIQKPQEKGMEQGY